VSAFGEVGASSLTGPPLQRWPHTLVVQGRHELRIAILDRIEETGSKAENLV
jgi:hypothetical protein